MRKNIRPIPTGENSVQYLISTSQNFEGHKKQGKSELSQQKGVELAPINDASVVSWVDGVMEPKKDIR